MLSLIALRKPNLIAVLILSCSPATAADIYRWVDEHGKVHMSDVVPEKYRKSAKRIDSSQFEVSPEDRTAAERRAAADRARAGAKPAAGADAVAAPPASQSIAAKPPAEPDCETARRMYQESIDCFAPFINANGTTHADAFKFCKQVPDPSRRCGPPRR
jgi:hypothetical protein